MTLTTSTQQPAREQRQTRASRRTGYVIGALVNAALLYAVNVWPGWQSLPFLTADTTRIIGVLNLSLAVSLGFQLAYLVSDPRWLRSLGDLVTTSIAFVVLVRTYQVFPFDFSEGGYDPSTLVRVVLVVLMVGTAIGVVAALVRLAQSLARRS